jgi:hypothetical protein
MHTCVHACVHTHACIRMRAYACVHTHACEYPEGLFTRLRTCLRHQRATRCPHPKIVPHTAWARHVPSVWAGCRGLSRTRSTRPATEWTVRQAWGAKNASYHNEVGHTVAAFMRKTLSACAADMARRGGASAAHATNRHSARFPAVARCIATLCLMKSSKVGHVPTNKSTRIARVRELSVLRGSSGRSSESHRGKLRLCTE